MGNDSVSWFLSRMMAIIFCGLVVVFFILLSAFQYMTPTTRTQVFFMNSIPAYDRKISIKPFEPSDSNLEEWTKAFVQEYVFKREQYDAGDYGRLVQLWGSEGPIAMFSSNSVYKEFFEDVIYENGTNPENMQTRTINIESIEKLNDVSNFKDPRNLPKWRVSVKSNENDISTGQNVSKDYTIDVTLKFDPPKEVNPNELEGNPLGIHVVDYKYSVTSWNEK